MTDLGKIRGIKQLVIDAVVNGTTAIERVHLETSKKPFSVLRGVPNLDRPAGEVEQIHDSVVATTYEAVRTVTRAVDSAIDVALTTIERSQQRGDQR